MNFNDLIRKKRDGGTLDQSELSAFVNGVTSAAIPDYQISAFLMATYFRGMTDKETSILTNEMANSGDTLDLSRFGTMSGDKHSTGGVGDKTTLIVAPIAAALGVKIAKMSGRALGHTGGTVDKLESIPGYRVELEPEEFLAQVERLGIAVIAQSGHLAPADKVLYALRDVTSTVDCPPLIASSIMSKKLAAGSHNIVLDVKVGSGSFLESYEDAEKLAEMMVNIGKHCNRRVRAVLTDMDTPLGYAVGNVLEVIEAIKVLRGEGPEDLRQVSLVLAANLVMMAREIGYDEAYKLAVDTLASGAAYEKFKAWICAQGGSMKHIEYPEFFGRANVVCEIKADRNGYIGHTDTALIGAASAALGAGRAKKGDKIDPLAGIVLKKKTGDEIEIGETLAELHTSTPEAAQLGAEKLRKAITVTDAPTETLPLILKTIGD